MGKKVEMGKEWVILSAIFIYLICVILITMRRVTFEGFFTPEVTGASAQGQYDSECYHY
jgi:hypothetical protein